MKFFIILNFCLLFICDIKSQTNIDSSYIINNAIERYIEEDTRKDKFVDYYFINEYKNVDLQKNIQNSKILYFKSFNDMANYKGLLSKIQLSLTQNSKVIVSIGIYKVFEKEGNIDISYSGYRKYFYKKICKKKFVFYKSEYKGI